jgi:hypothetical protein
LRGEGWRVVGRLDALGGVGGDKGNGVTIIHARLASTNKTTGNSIW